jgi:hypothetical protein
VPEWQDVEKEYTAMVPHREKRTATRTVCHRVPVTETRQVTRDRGHWERQIVEVPSRSCGGCGHCGGGYCGGTATVCRNVWVPNLVTEDVQYTRYVPQTSEQEYEYYVTVCRPETRTYTARVCNYKTETRTATVKVCEYRTETRSKTYQVCTYENQEQSRDVTYTVNVPQTQTKTFDVTSYKTVAEEKTETYRVRVPHPVQKEVDVRVCKMVPQTVTVPIGGYGYCGNGGRGRYRCAGCY